MFKDRWDTAIIRLFIESGIRAPELPGLNVADLDLDVAYVMGKGRRPRACPVCQDLPGTEPLPLGQGAPTVWRHFRRARLAGEHPRPSGTLVPWKTVPINTENWLRQERQRQTRPSLIAPVRVLRETPLEGAMYFAPQWLQCGQIGSPPLHRSSSM